MTKQQIIKRTLNNLGFSNYIVNGDENCVEFYTILGDVFFSEDARLDRFNGKLLKTLEELIFDLEYSGKRNDDDGGELVASANY